MKFMGNVIISFKIIIHFYFKKDFPSNSPARATYAVSGNIYYIDNNNSFFKKSTSKRRFS